MELPTQGHNDQDSRPSVSLRTRGDKDLAELAWRVPCDYQRLECPLTDVPPHKELEDSSEVALK